MFSDPRDREGLSREHCLHLLGTSTVGRVVLSVRALPLALPVRYSVVEESILFFIPAGSDVDEAARDAVVGFEADRIEERSGSGWSVHVLGRTAEVAGSALADVAVGSGMRPWDLDGSSHLMRLDPVSISGWRFGRW